MQPSSNLKPGSTASPGSSTVDHHETRTSPRKDTAHASSGSQYGRPQLGTPLRMANFYNTDPLFKQMQDALKPGARAASRSALVGALGELCNAMQVAVLDAEHHFSQTMHAKCATLLQAAKANQVVMLGKIDDLSDSDLGSGQRGVIREKCVTLGHALTEMLIKAGSLGTAQASLKKAEPSSDETAGITATSSAQKRAQGHMDSPSMTHTPSKRQKTGTPSSVASVTTAQQSPPAYRPVPRADLDARKPEGHSGSTAKDRVVQSPGSPTAKGSPEKGSRLRPQPRPRPASQLFAAPPDFTGQAQVGSTPRGSAPRNAGAGMAAVQPDTSGAISTPGHNEQRA